MNINLFLKIIYVKIVTKQITVKVKHILDAFILILLQIRTVFIY